MTSKVLFYQEVTLISISVTSRTVVVTSGVPRNSEGLRKKTYDNPCHGALSLPDMENVLLVQHFTGFYFTAALSQTCSARRGGE